MPCQQVEVQIRGDLTQEPLEEPLEEPPDELLEEPPKKLLEEPPEEPLEEPPWSYLVRLLAVGVGLPHQHPEAPHVALGGELEVVDTFGGVPLDGPLPVTLSLEGDTCFIHGAADLNLTPSTQITPVI